MYYQFMLKIKVKASVVINFIDVCYFVVWEVEWLGFNFDIGVVDYIFFVNMEAICEWVDGVKIFGEFNLQANDEILGVVDMFKFDVVQVGMFVDL